MTVVQVEKPNQSLPCEICPGGYRKLAVGLEFICIQQSELSECWDCKSLTVPKMKPITEEKEKELSRTCSYLSRLHSCITPCSSCSRVHANNIQASCTEGPRGVGVPCLGADCLKVLLDCFVHFLLSRNNLWWDEKGGGWAGRTVWDESRFYWWTPPG